MKICVTGGCGYTGTVLVPELLNAGHSVVVYDKMYYGNFLKPHPSLRIEKGDIRDVIGVLEAFEGCDAVVHLACISNDASFALDEKLSRSVNYDCFEGLVLSAKHQGVKRFIYASTSSVYGVSESKDVTEDHPFVPLTLYNKYKGLCEPILFGHCNENFTGVAFRPATVCGYSPRQRFDLSVNILTNQAVNADKITVFGGTQMRPNLHIDDYCRVVMKLLDAPAEKINKEAFNVGAENLSIIDIARLVQRTVMDTNILPPYVRKEIVISPTDDLRSYHINSDKIRNVLGFVPIKSVKQAVIDLCFAFQIGALPNSLTDERYFNVKSLQRQMAA